MSFEPENALEKALLRAITDPAARPDFYRSLLESELFIVGQMASGPAEQQPEPEQGGGRLMIATIEYRNKAYHPVFTALSRLRTFAPEEVQHMAIAGRTLSEASRGAHFLLNPGSECGKELSADEIAGVLSHLKVPRVGVRPPKVHPKALADALSQLFARIPEVAAAYVVEIMVEGSDEPAHPLIGVDTKGDWQALSQQMGEVMKTVPLETVVDLLPIDRAAPTGIMQALLQTPPFYNRETKAQPS